LKIYPAKIIRKKITPPGFYISSVSRKIYNSPQFSEKVQIKVNFKKKLDFTM